MQLKIAFLAIYNFDQKSKGTSKVEQLQKISRRSSGLSIKVASPGEIVIITNACKNIQLIERVSHETISKK